MKKIAVLCFGLQHFRQWAINIFDNIPNVKFLSDIVVFDNTILYAVNHKNVAREVRFDEIIEIEGFQKKPIVERAKIVKLIKRCREIPYKYVG